MSYKALQMTALAFASAGRHKKTGCEHDILMPKNTMKTLASCAVACVLVTLAYPASGQAARPRPATAHEVLALYYPWYGSPERRGHPVHWGKIDTDKRTISNCAHYPAQGAYDSMDPALVDRQIALAQSNGITGFIASWWGQGKYEDKALPILLERAAKRSFKISICWEKASGEGRAQIDQAISDLVYVLTRYGTNETFLKVSGKPVVFVYERVMKAVPLASWPAILNATRAKAGPLLLIADGYRETYATSFAGLHRYNISGGIKGKNQPELRAWAEQYYPWAVQFARKYNLISCVTVIPGYDDTKVRKPGRNVDRWDGQLYGMLWEQAIKSAPDWVLITSWNEWHEGTEIEPSVESGDKYIKITSEYSRRFLRSRPVGTSTPASR